MDLLVVCGLGVMMNVLCHATYSAPGLDRELKMNTAQVRLWNHYDVNGLTEDDRKLFCLTRGQSIELVSWLSATYTTGIPDIPAQKLFATVLVNICTMLCNYKWQADNQRMDSAPDFTIGRLKIQIHAALLLVIQKLDPSAGAFGNLDCDARNWKLPMEHSTFEQILPHITGLNIQKSSAPPYERKSLRELFKMGETLLDQKFAQRLEVKREIIGVFDTISHFYCILTLGLPDIDVPPPQWR